MGRRKTAKPGEFKKGHAGYGQRNADADADDETDAEDEGDADGQKLMDPVGEFE